jgi:hypothetical protein
MALDPLLVLVPVPVLQAKSFCWEALRSQPLAANGVQRARAKARSVSAVFQPPFRSGPPPRAVRPKKPLAHQLPSSVQTSRTPTVETSGALEARARGGERFSWAARMDGWVHTLIVLIPRTT